MSEAGKPWRFCALVLIVSAPFWLLGAVLNGPAPFLPIQLPISALMAVAPSIAALLLVWSGGGVSEARRLVGQLTKPPVWRRPVWLLAAVMIMPGVLTAAWLWMNLTGAALGAPQVDAGALTGFLLMFLLGAVAEELGWQGYLYPRLARRLPALAASLAVGLFWALWHVIPFVQAGREPGWIVWQCLAMLPLRVLTVWLWGAGGRSLGLAVAFHLFSNLAQFLFPDYGSHYDPQVTAIILAVVAAGVVLTTGPRTLGDRGDSL